MLPRLIDQLDGAEDIEHPDVAVSHESGWTVSLFRSGTIIFENVEDRESPHVHVSANRDEQLIAAAVVASGRPNLIADWPWLPGNG